MTGFCFSVQRAKSLKNFTWAKVEIKHDDVFASHPSNKQKKKTKKRMEKQPFLESVKVARCIFLKIALRNLSVLR